MPAKAVTKTPTIALRKLTNIRFYGLKIVRVIMKTV